MQSRLDRIGTWISAALPIAAALAHAPLVDDGAHDASIVRALGLGVAGLPSVDALVAAPFVVLPIGTLIFRLVLVSALAAGAAGMALHLVARALIGRVLGESSPRLTVAVATVASLAATLSRPWQVEASAPLACTLAAAFWLTIVATVLRPGFVAAAIASRARVLQVAGALALAVALVAGFWALRRWKSDVVFSDLTSSPLAAFDRARAAAFLTHYVGAVTAMGAAAGLVVAIVLRASRRLAIALGALGLLALASVAQGSAAGPERFDTVTLLASAFANVFAAAGVASLVRWVARLRVPLASASAAMVAVLGAAFPAIAYDESSIASDERAALDAVDWAPAVLGGLRPGTMIIGDDPRPLQRLVAASLVGEAPEGLAFVPLYDVGGKMVRRQLDRTPELVPLVRDITLTGFPTELAMTKLAADRAVVLFFSSRWERALTRHLVPDAALDHFEPEPRGAVDRRNGVDLAEQSLVPLARVLAGASAETLARSTAELLHTRVLALSLAGERELAFRVLEEVRAFVPNDAFIAPMETRLRAKGTIELRDLARR